MAEASGLVDGESEKSRQDKDFETIAREVAVAAREQGGDPDENLRLRLAIRRAEDANMPEDAIETARLRGTGKVEGPNYDEVTYEGYGPDGVAVFVEAITDDKSRTQEELSALFEQYGGNLGEDGCVAWQFEHRGLVEVDADDIEDPDEFMLEVIEMGADELRDPIYETRESGQVPTYRVYCKYQDLHDLAAALEDAGYGVHDASPIREATQKVGLERDRARNFLKFYEKLSNHEDVQHAYANWESA